MRSPEDANEAFNLSEEAQPGYIPTLLWRGELYLEKYDPGHAEEVVQEILDQLPPMLEVIDGTKSKKKP